MRTAFLAIVLSAMATPVAAQWLKLPTPGIPRTSDGKPDLSAPAPRTSDGKPDLSGLWGMDAGPYLFNVTADLKPDEIQPWADALFKERTGNFGKDDGGKLFIDKVPATPLSETRFSLGGQRIEFVKDAQGNVTHYVTLYVEGDLISVKKPDAR
jgi:hypothetical protein